ncbi:c-di-GMP-binding flagellar brake protein YcgR [Oikeobacillus pervagus]|uniref:C-di-GMP-binding flagellar brake protein YcgR n=1 Tax=Oikeobacillus pervagus TaxID=1325931 RepID=A0AAJ1SVP9_9BACI|nr:flagellar brake domain-containing protein [Oikeobacillus pervagus]MDQ0213715.1 c-di-GMP-binding flagellar brake protein YcgR [Oikeobacillus pervagus]
MLKIGMTLTLEPVEMTDSKEQFKCKVVEMEESKLFITYPINVVTNKTSFLLDGMQLKASFIGGRSAVFMFETEVIDRVKKKIPMLVLQDPGPSLYIRIQRRRFVRVMTGMDISATFASIPTFTTCTEDVSAGGMAILIPEHIHLEQGMDGEFLMVVPMQSGEYHYIKVRGKVIRIWEDLKRNIASIEFIELSSTIQQTLLRFCFQRQLALRKKGLTE